MLGTDYGRKMRGVRFNSSREHRQSCELETIEGSTIVSIRCFAEKEGEENEAEGENEKKRQEEEKAECRKQKL